MSSPEIVSLATKQPELLLTSDEADTADSDGDAHAGSVLDRLLMKQTSSHEAGEAFAKSHKPSQIARIGLGSPASDLQS